MRSDIRPFRPGDVEPIVAFVVAAWTPISDSMRRTVGERVHGRLHPDWPTMQAQAVRDTCSGLAMRTVVAVDNGRPVGFVAFPSDRTASIGMIEMVAVDREHQGRGIGTALTAPWTHRVVQDSPCWAAGTRTRLRPWRRQ